VNKYFVHSHQRLVEERRKMAETRLKAGTE